MGQPPDPSAGQEHPSHDVCVGLFLGRSLVRRWSSTPQDTEGYATFVHRYLKRRYADGRESLIRIATRALPPAEAEACKEPPAPWWWLRMVSR